MLFVCKQIFIFFYSLDEWMYNFFIGLFVVFEQGFLVYWFFFDVCLGYINYELGYFN